MLPKFILQLFILCYLQFNLPTSAQILPPSLDILNFDLNNRFTPAFPTNSVSQLRELLACYRDRRESSLIVNPLSKVQLANETIIREGYRLVTHYITTKDGYILSVFRITGGLRSPYRRGKPAVILWHGLANSGEMWTIHRDGKSLAYMLVDAGYEAWLVNDRGTDFSLGHVSLNANTDIRYWDFSFEEMGRYDLPAVVDFVLAETRLQKVHYVCFSQGCATFAVTMSEHPDYNQYFNSAFLMAPAIYIGTRNSLDITSSFFSLLSYRFPQVLLYQGFRGRLDLRNPLMLRGLPPSSASSIRTSCEILNPFLLDHNQIDDENILELYARVFNVVNIKSFYHYSQVMENIRFAKYNYGASSNFQMYGAYLPPKFDLKQITTPLYIWYGDADEAVTPANAERFKSDLRPEVVKGFYQVNATHFSHLSFMISNRNDDLIYRPILELMNEISNMPT